MPNGSDPDDAESLITGASPASQYPRLWIPGRGMLAPLPLSPLGESGTQMFWRQQLTEAPLPPNVPDQTEPIPPQLGRPANDPIQNSIPVPGTLDRPSYHPFGPNRPDIQSAPPTTSFTSAFGAIGSLAQSSPDLQSLISWLESATLDT